MIYKSDHQKAEEQVRRDIWYGRLVQLSVLGFIAWVAIQVMKHFSII